MENISVQHKAEYADLFRAARNDIDAGVVAANTQERKRYWGHWTQFVKPLRHVDPMLTWTTTGRDIPVGTRTILLGAFARRVRIGKYTRDGNGVRAQTVQVALRAIGATFELVGKPNPTYRSEGRYWLPIQ